MADRGERGARPEARELDGFDSTLTNLAGVILPCLDAAGAASVVEIGAEHGLFTRELLAWGAGSGARVVAVDTAPDPLLSELAENHPELELVVATSLEALAGIDPPDAVVVDGDHNYYTVSEELRLIAERASGPHLPLVLLHDVGWPHGRRDSYYVPERIPAEHRQPVFDGAFLVPDEPGVTANGLFFDHVAPREGGPGNGVLTAVDDFVAKHEELELAVVPAFFGLAVVWDRGAPWAGAVAEVVAPLDRNPVLEQVERRRIEHLVAEHVNLQRLDSQRHDEREIRRDAVRKLLPMHDSFALTVGERVSRMKAGGADPSLSRAALWHLISKLARDDIDVDELREEG